MTKGITHVTVGSQLTQAEFEQEGSHTLSSGTSFPGSPSEGDLFYRTDLHKWYIYNGTAWVTLTLVSALNTVTSSSLKYSDDPERTKLINQNYYSQGGVKVKEMKLNDPLTKITVKYDHYASGGNYHCVWIKKNGVSLDLLTDNLANSYTTESRDITTQTFAAGDLLQIFVSGRSNGEYANQTVYIRNFRIYFDVTFADVTLQDP